MSEQRPFVVARNWGWRPTTRKAWALKDLSFTIRAGEKILLLGPSGSGKSTLLRTIAGILEQDEGEHEGHIDINRSIRVGLVLQDADSQIVHAKVGDDVAFGCQNISVPAEEIPGRVRAALDEVGLDISLGHSSDILSGGEKQRLVLAGALAMRPDALVLDEPTANLDPLGVTEVVDAVARAVKEHGSTLIVVEHRVDLWAPIVGRVIVLNSAGEIIADGDPDEVFESHRTELLASGVWIPGVPVHVPPRRRSDRPNSGLSEPILETRSLDFGWRVDSPLGTSMDCAIFEHTSTVITGRNGSGKSTLALTIAGLLAPLGGALVAAPALSGGLQGEPIEWRSKDLATRIGMVFQEPGHQFLARTVHGEVLLGVRVFHRALGRVSRKSLPDLTAEATRILEQVGLAHLANADPFTLSGGEQRRLTIAAIAAARPKVLIVDEPTFGQDRNTWVAIVNLIGELVDAGSALLSVTHDMDFASALGDQCIDLDMHERFGRITHG